MIDIRPEKMGAEHEVPPTSLIDDSSSSTFEPKAATSGSELKKVITR